MTEFTLIKSTTIDVLNQKEPMDILISAWSKKLRNGKPNPKNYPYWVEVVSGLKEKGHNVTQLLYAPNDEPKIIQCDNFIEYKSLIEAETIIQSCKIWISVDNWIHHYAFLIKKPGIVIWSRSNPKFFGYVEQINLLKDKKYLRPKQFEWWENDVYEKDAFIEPNAVINAVNSIFL